MASATEPGWKSACALKGAQVHYFALLAQAGSSWFVHVNIMETRVSHLESQHSPDTHKNGQDLLVVSRLGRRKEPEMLGVPNRLASALQVGISQHIMLTKWTWLRTELGVLCSVVLCSRWCHRVTPSEMWQKNEGVSTCEWSCLI